MTYNPNLVAVDMDDVMVDFLGGLLDSVYIETGVRIERASITKWDLHPLLDPILGRDFWDWLKDKEWIWAHFPAYPGAVQGLERLRRASHEIEAVTAKPDWAVHNVYKWLGRWRVPVRRVVVVGTKDNKAHNSNARWLIDDKPQNCYDWADTGRPSILFSQPHNERFGVPIYGYRAKNWQEAVDIITENDNGR